MGYCGKDVEVLSPSSATITWTTSVLIHTICREQFRHIIIVGQSCRVCGDVLLHCSNTAALCGGCSGLNPRTEVHLGGLINFDSVFLYVGSLRKLGMQSLATIQEAKISPDYIQ